jgi:NAD(P)-dependent dehydrogenase (short-subunit alcohol dehydrogenase family)
MGTLRFDGRVAIVTGAGGRPSLGRSYAQLLASRGARVVVNDFGVGPDGHGLQRAHADLVAREIADAGGEAVADTNSVAGEDSARAIVQTALDAWGRVDILVNNAGVIGIGPFDEMPAEDVQRMVDVHLLGTVWMCRAVWPHMQKAGYGRIVNITSNSSLGMATFAVYSAVKGGVLSLARALAGEGASAGIVVNALSPGATTNASTYFAGEAADTGDDRRPELVAAAAAFLAHEDCPFSGKYIDARSGAVTEIFQRQTHGYRNPELTPEDVAANLGSILDRERHTDVPDVLLRLEDVIGRFKS